MKNQYFGDVGDYGKYGLLRFLSKQRVTVAINWYLTANDESNDGNIRSYLEKEKNRLYDPELFDVLKELCEHNEKNVRCFAEYGMIPGAKHIYVEDPGDCKELGELPRDRKLIFYCQIGRKSADMDETLECFEGRDCYSLAEGYVGFIRSGMQNEGDKEEKRKRAEESIQKKFHKQLFSPFAKACKTYKLIEDGDRLHIRR